MVSLRAVPMARLRNTHDANEFVKHLRSGFYACVVDAIVMLSRLLDRLLEGRGSRNLGTAKGCAENLPPGTVVELWGDAL